MMRFIITLLCLFAFTHIAQAEVVPKAYGSDKHIQIATYDPNQVYKISTMQGYITAIQFGDGEKVISVNIGDSSSWLVNVQNDVINLKPIADYPDTNMNVLTSRGTYQFSLTAAPPEKDANGAPVVSKGLRKPLPGTAFLVRFRYKDDAPANNNTLDAQQSNVDNWSYTARGDASVAPLRVHDNQRFTFFEFGDLKDIPAIFSVDMRGMESLVNYHMQGNYVVVETTARQFTLRNGRQVATVFNEAVS